MKKLLFLLSLITSFGTFAQTISVLELTNNETGLLPIQVRSKVSPFGVQQMVKNKVLTVDVLKEYIVAGSNLKFIAQDQVGVPVGNATDARIIISENGNSISLRPRGYVPNSIVTKIELYHTFASIVEKNTGYLYKTLPLYSKTESFSTTTSNVIVLSGFKDLYQVSGSYRYTDVNLNEHTISIDAVTTNPKISIDLVSKIVTALPFDCSPCTNKQYEIKLTYTKP